VIVLVLTAVPEGLRGDLTRWMLEISAGVFVAKLPARTRDELCERTVELLSAGRAIMVFSARNEQGLEFRVHGHHWRPVDVEGISLMLRPTDVAAQGSSPAASWSNASRRRRAPR
jgi:CRISPR-associated protein Cas2